MVHLFSKLRESLTKTRVELSDRIDEAAESACDPEELYLDLEEIMILSDIGAGSASFLVDEMRGRLGVYRKIEPTRVRDTLIEIIGELLFSVEKPLVISPPLPFVILVVGVNGSGKTTTIGKIARGLKESGYSVLLGAGDTFRAAAIEQLELWGEKVGAHVVKHRPGADASAVVFDSLRAAVTRKTDVVIIDTAGRLHTKKNLMDELGKIKRVISKEVPHAPSETLLVMDATTGQNGIIQAKSFSGSLGVTGLAITKIDGTAKGGVLIAITRELNIPVRYIGVGEGVDDLRSFIAEDYARALFISE